MSIFIVLGVIVWITNLIMCVWLAQEKHRSEGTWFTLAFFFGLVATLWLAGAPSRK